MSSRTTCRVRSCPFRAQCEVEFGARSLSCFSALDQEFRACQIAASRGRPSLGIVEPHFSGFGRASQLGSFYPLIRSFTWSGRRDSNPRPSPWQLEPASSFHLRILTSAQIRVSFSYEIVQTVTDHIPWIGHGMGTGLALEGSASTKVALRKRAGCGASKSKRQTPRGTDCVSPNRHRLGMPTSVTNLHLDSDRRRLNPWT